MTLSSVPVLRELAQLQIGYLWYNLGVELNIPIHVLETLVTNFPTDAVRCSIHMFDSWLKNDQEATYAKLLKALVAINRKSVAIDICRKKCECYNIDIFYLLSLIGLVFALKNDTQRTFPPFSGSTLRTYTINFYLQVFQ